MKKLLLSLSLGLFTQVNAQHQYYTGGFDTLPFVALDSIAMLFGQNTVINLGFTIPFFDMQSDTMRIGQALGFFLDEDGAYGMTPFSGLYFDDVFDYDQNTKLKYKISGVSPNKKITLEYKGVRLQFDTNANINYQITAHENGNITLHFANSSNTTNFGQSKWTPIITNDNLYIGYKQNPMAPTFFQVDADYIDSLANINQFLTLDSFPINGMRYQWVYQQNLSTNTVFEKQLQNTLYPNPIKQNDVLNLKNIKLKDIISIKDISGKTVISKKGTDSIDLQNLPSGFYIVSVNRNNYKLIIE